MNGVKNRLSEGVGCLARLKLCSLFDDTYVIEKLT